MGLHEGHRQRMYEKLKKNAMEEHEWLEMLLFMSVPRRNTNDLSHRLIQRFGSVEEVLKASLEELQTVEGVGIQIAAHLKCIEHFCDHYRRDKSKEYIDTYTVEGFVSYLKTHYKMPPYEIMDIYLLDPAGYIIRKESFTTEELSRVSVCPTIISRVLLTKNLKGVVVVHNHPRGTKGPSDIDDDMTKRMLILCSAHNITLCDHLICTRDGVYSYNASKRLKKLRDTYAVEMLIQNN